MFRRRLFITSTVIRQFWKLFSRQSSNRQTVEKKRFERKAPVPFLSWPLRGAVMQLCCLTFSVLSLKWWTDTTKVACKCHAAALKY